MNEKKEFSNLAPRVVTFDVLAGAFAHDVALELLGAANSFEVPCRCLFNGTEMLARPGDTVDVVLKSWGR